MLINFWIASHLGDETRLVLFNAMLKSISEQTVQPDHVYISLSYNKNVRPPKQEEIKSILNNINFTLVISDKKLYQFEHLYNIWKSAINTTWVLFSDDDDLNGPNRVKSFKEILNQNLTQKIFLSESFTFHNNLYENREPWILDFNSTIKRKNVNLCDFGSYICHISVLDSFFVNIYFKYKKVLISHMDLLFQGINSDHIKILGNHYAIRRGYYPRYYNSMTDSIIN